MTDMFVRIGTQEHVDAALMMLEEFDPRIDTDLELGTVTVYAPDGDVVFMAIPKDGGFICRYHKEVFDQDSSVGG